MLTNFLYNGRNTKIIKNQELQKVLSDSKSRIWIKASNLNKEEKLILKEVFNVHPTTIEDVSTQQTRMKYEEFNSYTFIIVKGVKEIKKTAINTYNLSFIIGENYIVTINNEINPIIEELANHENKIENFLKKDEDYIAHYILDKEVDRYMSIKLDFGESLKQIEMGFAEKPDKKTIKELFSKELLFLEFRQLIESVTDVCLSLTKPADNYINNSLIPYFRDVYDHSFKTAEGVKAMLERMNRIRDIDISISSMKMNETIKLLTIIMALMMPLTVITGFYGMNVSLPLQKNPFVWLFLFGLMIISAVVMILISRKRGWVNGNFE